MTETKYSKPEMWLTEWMTSCDVITASGDGIPDVGDEDGDGWIDGL